MPNKLSDEKMRKTLTEHKAVIAMLEKVAADKNTTIMNLMRDGIRSEIRRYAADEAKRLKIYGIAKMFEPTINKESLSPADLARFKRKQRDFDSLLMELNLETPERMEEMNSIVSPTTPIRIREFSGDHA